MNNSTPTRKQILCSSTYPNGNHRVCQQQLVFLSCLSQCSLLLFSMIFPFFRFGYSLLLSSQPPLLPFCLCPYSLAFSRFLSFRLVSFRFDLRLGSLLVFFPFSILPFSLWRFSFFALFPIRFASSSVVRFLCKFVHSFYDDFLSFGFSHSYFHLMREFSVSTLLCKRLVHVLGWLPLPYGCMPKAVTTATPIVGTIE